MRLLKRKRSTPAPAATPPADAPKGRQTSVPLEIKLFALEATEQGLARREVAEIIGVSPLAINGWQKKHDTEGLTGIYRKPASAKARGRCQTLEKRILARRREHPEHGVHRIRDDLKRAEGLAALLSEET